MTEEMKQIKKYILNKKHAKFRKNKDWDKSGELTESQVNTALGSHELLLRKKNRLIWMLEQEQPAFIPGMDLVFMRTIVENSCIVNTNEEKALRNQYYLHEKGHVCNISPDYSEVLAGGFESIEKKIQKAKTEPGGSDKEEYADILSEIIRSIYSFTEKYAEALEEDGRKGKAVSLRRSVHTGAESFPEALQLLRLLHYLAWLEGEYHIGLGRFDQYLYPYYKEDSEKGRLTDEEAFSCIEEFFLACNIDNDLYPGVQQGDNGQSLMLGGVDKDGKDCFNELSEMCLRASRELKLIDPKINLRVNQDTGIKQYEEATRLTKAGLGFPQYSNDDVVIPALTRWGYQLEDARNYTVAACWEFIIPGKGMDIPNIEAVSFPKIVNRCVEKYLKETDSFGAFKEKLLEELKAEVDDITKRLEPIFMYPAPYLSMLMYGCTEELKDISQGCVYNNYGLHGTGISCAADSLYALEMYYFTEKKITAEELIGAVRDDFPEDLPYLKLVRDEMPHMGDGNPAVDKYGVWLLDAFAEEVDGRKNERGGIYRAGTGSAMYYIRHAEELGASPDGRRKGEYFPANFSPGLSVKTKGPLSVIKSFTAPNLERVANGGPLTLEFHDSVFRGEEGIQKVASLVQMFIKNKGHQLQLNAINAETLKDAQRHPENYRNLIVRVWGWSAYFVELDKVYQDHLIRRAEYTV